MSFFVDDNEFQESTEFKCSSDPTQRAFRHAVERAIQYARNQGVTPVAALGNSDQDLAHPVDDDGQPISNECEVVPAETQGVIGTASLGPPQREGRLLELRHRRDGRRGAGRQRHDRRLHDDDPVHLPRRRLRLHPGHLDGLAARGRRRRADRQPVRPAGLGRRREAVAAEGRGTACRAAPSTSGCRGYDECFGNGRIDALRAVTGDTSDAVRRVGTALPGVRRVETHRGEGTARPWATAETVSSGPCRYAVTDVSSGTSSSSSVTEPCRPTRASRPGDITRLSTTAWRRWPARPRRRCGDRRPRDTGP